MLLPIARLTETDPAAEAQLLAAASRTVGAVRALADLGAEIGADPRAFAGVGGRFDRPAGSVGVEALADTDLSWLIGADLAVGLEDHVQMLVRGSRTGGEAPPEIELGAGLIVRFDPTGPARSTRGDQDADGVPDEQDACPSIWGLDEEGCFRPLCRCPLDDLDDRALADLVATAGRSGPRSAFVVLLRLPATADAGDDWRRTRAVERRAGRLLSWAGGGEIVVVGGNPTAARRWQIVTLTLPADQLDTYLEATRMGRPEGVWF